MNKYIKIMKTPENSESPDTVNCWKCHKQLSYKEGEAMISCSDFHAIVCETCALNDIIATVKEPTKAELALISDAAYNWLKASKPEGPRLRLVLQDLAASIMYDREIHTDFAGMGGCLTLAEYDAIVDPDPLAEAVKRIVIGRQNQDTPKYLIPMLMHEIGCDAEMAYLIPAEPED
jgi:hypothetical protein